METIKNNIEAVIEYLNGLDNSEQIRAWNQMCQNDQRGDDEIYSNDEEFFNMFFDGKVIEAVRAVSYGEYNFQDDWVMFNGYANLESFNSPDAHIDLTEIANDILENPSDYDIELEDDEFMIIETDEEGNEDEVESYLTQEEADEKIKELQTANPANTYEIKPQE